MQPTHVLSRSRIWRQFLTLAGLRILRRGNFAPIRLTYPPIEIHASKNPWGLFREIFVREYYRPLIPFDASPRIVDLGANIGMASLYFVSRWPMARIEAYEPNPASFELLGKNLQPDRFPQAEIILHQAALSTGVATADFTVPEGNPTSVCAGLSTGASEDAPGSRISVPTADAAEVFSRPADLVKLDIEGHEYDVLEHALPHSSCIRSMVVEFHDMNRDSSRCERLLRRLLGEGGYSAQDEDGTRLDPARFARHSGARHAHFHSPVAG